MTEHFLDRSDIRAILEESRRERMPQRMGRHIFDDSGFESLFFYHVRDMDARKSVIFSIGYIGDICRIEVVAYECGLETISTRGKIIFDPLGGSICKVNNANFTSFTTDGELESLEIDVTSVECGKLTDTQPGRIDTLHDRVISESS